MREPTQTWTPQPPSRGHHGREPLAGDEAQSRSQRPCTRLALSGVLAHVPSCSKLRVRPPLAPRSGLACPRA